MNIVEQTPAISSTFFVTYSVILSELRPLQEFCLGRGLFFHANRSYDNSNLVDERNVELCPIQDGVFVVTTQTMFRVYMQE